ncbi:Tubulin glycylase 3C [Durusdinium trenchii]|uniref:Tubulin glycylase 3C n=1 Tax=Durusdinium trenchii TaxID=1381693 RepID=A0ABP0QN62_9DINO
MVRVWCSSSWVWATERAAVRTGVERETRSSGPTRPRVACLLRVWDARGDCVVVGGGGLEWLGDKDVLAKALDGSGLVPETHLVAWDAQEVGDVVMPETRPAVLKPPLGCGGEGIAFVQNAEQVLELVSRDAAQARKEPGFLESIEARKGRIPSWVVQAHVRSVLLHGHKFHARVYVVRTPQDALLMYDGVELRIAEKAYEEGGFEDRGRHITNGAGAGKTRREMLDEHSVELPGVSRALETLAKALSPVLLQRAQLPGVYGIAALDAMMDADSGQAVLLEINTCRPACPPEGMGSQPFQAHLPDFIEAILRLVLFKSTSSSSFIELSPPE